MLFDCEIRAAESNLRLPYRRARRRRIQERAAGDSDGRMLRFSAAQ